MELTAKDIYKDFVARFPWLKKDVDDYRIYCRRPEQIEIFFKNDTILIYDYSTKLFDVLRLGSRTDYMGLYGKEEI